MQQLTKKSQEKPWKDFLAEMRESELITPQMLSPSLRSYSPVGFQEQINTDIFLCQILNVKKTFFVEYEYPLLAE